VQLVGHVKAVEEIRTDGASLRLPALLLWTEELGAIPDDASEAALRRLRAEALKAIERVEAATEGRAADLPPAAPPGPFRLSDVIEGRPAPAASGPLPV
jgi:hypothetical protein